ncbi:MAG: RodZ domain-containing protein [Elusimicrobiota bacterium]
MSERMEEGARDIGALLRKRRLLRGQSLETVHQHTRIPKRFIEAIETNRFDDFPARVYLRGFLKNYCDYLDMEFEPLWKQLDPAPRGDAAREESGDAPDGRQSRAASHPLLLPFTESTLLPFALFAGLAVVGTLLWALKGGGPSATSSSAPAPGNAGESYKLPLETRPGKPRIVTLRVTAVRDGWIRLKVDGGLRFEGRMPAGTSQQWRGTKAFLLRASDPRAIRVELDDTETDLAALVLEPDGSYLLRR